MTALAPTSPSTDLDLTLILDAEFEPRCQADHIATGTRCTVTPVARFKTNHRPTRMICQSAVNYVNRSYADRGLCMECRQLTTECWHVLPL